MQEQQSYCAVPENIHTHPWKVNGNSEEVRGLKGQNFKRKVWRLSGNSRGVGGGGGLNQKTFRGRGMDIFWNNILAIVRIRPD